MNLQIIQADHEEELVGFYEILMILIQYKYHVVIITLVAIIFSLTYALWSSPVYQAETHLLPPHTRDIAGLNIIEDSYDEQQVYEIFTNTLESRAIRFQFFRESEQFAGMFTDNISENNLNELFEEKFNSKIAVKKNRAGTGRNLLVITLTSDDSNYAARTLNSFVNFVNQSAIDSLVRNVESILRNNIADLQLEIESLRTTAVKMNIDEIAALEDSFKTAEKLGITKAIANGNYASEPNNDDASEVKLKLQYEQAYRRGTDALSAELEVVRNRKNLDFMIPALRNLENQISIISAKLKRIAAQSGIKTVTVDRPALDENKRIKPDRKKIMIIGSISGFVLGMIVALLLNFLSTVRRK